MKFHLRLIELLAMLVAVPAFAGIPDSPRQVRPLSVGARAPIFAARTSEGALRTRDTRQATSAPRRSTRSPRRGNGRGAMKSLGLGVMFGSNPHAAPTLPALRPLR